MGKHKNDRMSTSQVISNFRYAFALMVKVYPIQFTLQILLGVLTTVTSFLSYTYLLRYVVNSLQKGTDFSSVLTYLTVVVIITIIVNVLQQLYENTFKPILDARSNAEIEISLFKKTLQMDMENFEDPEAFELYNRATTMGVDAIKKTMNVVDWLFRAMMELVMTSWLFLLIDPVLFIFAFFPLIINILDMKTEDLWYNYEKREREINRKKEYTRRVFYVADYAKEIRLTNISQVMLRQFEDAVKEFFTLVKKEGLKKSIVSFTIDFGVQGISILGAEMYALFRTLVSRAMMYGDCLVVLNSIGKISWNVMNFGQMFVNVYEIGLNIQDYRQFVNKVPAVGQNLNGKDIIEGDIRLENVSFKYHSAKNNSLTNISMTIRRGQKVAIVGENGAGKTTLVKLLMRLYDVTDGSIFVQDVDIREFKLKPYRSMFGVVFQDVHQLSVSIAENVLGRPYKEDDEILVQESLKKAGAWDFVSRLPNGIHTRIDREFDEKGAVLSQGEFQKIAIAAVYAKKCNIVILDEPSSALDPIAEHNLYESMFEACRDKTIIFISHRMSSAVDADVIFVLNDGKLIESGSHSELLELKGKYSEMFTVQAMNYVNRERGDPT